MSHYSYSYSYSYPLLPEVSQPQYTGLVFKRFTEEWYIQTSSTVMLSHPLIMKQNCPSWIGPDDWHSSKGKTLSDTRIESLIHVPEYYPRYNWRGLLWYGAWSWCIRVGCHVMSSHVLNCPPLWVPLCGTSILFYAVFQVIMPFQCEMI